MDKLTIGTTSNMKRFSSIPTLFLSGEVMVGKASFFIKYLNLKFDIFNHRIIDV